MTDELTEAVQQPTPINLPPINITDVTQAQKVEAALVKYMISLKTEEKDAKTGITSEVGVPKVIAMDYYGFYSDEAVKTYNNSTDLYIKTCKFHAVNIGNIAKYGELYKDNIIEYRRMRSAFTNAEVLHNDRSNRGLLGFDRKEMRTQTAESMVTNLTPADASPGVLGKLAGFFKKRTI